MNTRQADQAEAGVDSETQPNLGLKSAAVVVGVFIVLGILPGLERSMTILGPITLFALPVLAAIAFYWNGWPGSYFAQPISGLINTVVIALGGIVFTAAAQFIVGPRRLDGIFAEGAGSTTWPWTLPLGALLFWAVLQLTLVSEKWPLQKLKPIPQGFAMLTYAWIVSVAAYLLMANWDAFPAVVEAGLLNPGGFWDGIDLIGFTVIVIAWQVVLFFLLGGWPFNSIDSDRTRRIIANVAPILLGLGTYLLLTGPVFSLNVPQVGAIGGTIVLGAFTIGLLFESWPMNNDPPAAQRIGQLLGTGLIAGVAYFGLRALGSALETFEANPIELWVAISALNYLAAVIVLYCLIWERWPFDK